MTFTKQLTTLGLLATLAAASCVPALAGGRNPQSDKNNMRNLAIAGAAVAGYGLLNHNNIATLLGAAGAALAGNQYEKDRKQQSQDSNDRYDRRYHRNGYDTSGYNRDGYNHDGYNRDGFNRDGFNRDGWDSEGYNRDGNRRNAYPSDDRHDGYDGGHGNDNRDNDNGRRSGTGWGQGRVFHSDGGRSNGGRTWDTYGDRN